MILGVFLQEHTKEIATPMALTQSVLSELLDAFRAGEGVDLVRDAVRLVMQELIEVEAAETIGAQRYERTETRTTERNGSRPRLLATRPATSSCASPPWPSSTRRAILTSSPSSTAATNTEDQPRNPTTARDSILRTDQLIPPRFAPCLSTTHGGFSTRDPGVSPDRTHTGWLP